MGKTGVSGRKGSALLPALASEKDSGHVCERYHHAVELIGRRWSGAILSVLLRGPKGFNELLAAVPGMSDRLLAERLKELEAEGVIVRSVSPGPPVRVSYELTEAGAELEPVLVSLGRWAERWVEA